MADINEICLHIDGQDFNVKKSVLCEHSDYFRAMFSGNYVEDDQQDIVIEMVDANSMNIILRYMDLGLIDLSEYPLQVIGNLAMAANFLQITELIKQIEYCLDLQLSVKNWVHTMVIAENALYTKLEQLAAAYGLFSFKTMKPENIPTIDKLFWYLSHPYLDAGTELAVFKFGFNWILNNEMGADAFLIILGCLDVTKLTREDVNEIALLMKDYPNSLPAKIAECLQTVFESHSTLSLPILASEKDELCKLFSERVYSEVLNIVKESRERLYTVYTPVVPVWILKHSQLEYATHYMYTFCQEKGFEKWLEVAEKDLWGWNIASWGANKLIVVCGERGRGTGQNMKDVRVYDALRKEWTHHGVSLPPRRHAGVTVLGDSLFIVGGVGGYRVVLDTAIVYDLIQRSYRKIAKLPDALQSPAICTHKGSVYASGQTNIYKYEDFGDTDRWKLIVTTDIRTSRMISYKDHIYCTQNYFSHLYRFNPDNYTNFEIITHLGHPAAAFCNIGDCLMIFTRPKCGQSEPLSVELYRGNMDKESKIIWKTTDCSITINDVAGGCSLAISLPTVHIKPSQYHQKYVTRYTNRFKE